MRTITISRQYGSGGKRIAVLLSEKLGIPYYDSSRLLLAGERYGISSGLVEALEKNTSLLYGLAKAADPTNPGDRLVLPGQMFQAQMDSMKRLAGEGPCIFLGRCADHILRDQENLLRVYVYASNMEDRISRVKYHKNLSQREALSRIAEKDHRRMNYYHFYTGQEWGRKENYDLCLNTSTMDIDTCVELIAKLSQYW